MKFLKSSILLILVFLVSFTTIIQAETSASTDYRQWKQNGEPFGALAYYGSNVGQYVGYSAGNSFQTAACFVVSTAIQIKRSGVDSRSDFTPVSFAIDMTNNGGFTGDGGFVHIAPYRIYGEGFMMVTPINNNGKVEFVSGSPINITSSTPEDMYDLVLKYCYDEGLYMVLRGTTQAWGTPHYVAVEKAENGEIYVNDPGSEYTTLSELNANTMRASGWLQIVLFRSNVKDFTQTLNQSSTVAPNEDEIAVAVAKWDGETVPGLPTEYDASWESGVLPAGYTPYSEEYEDIISWQTDVDLYNANLKTSILRQVFMYVGLGFVGYSFLLLLAGVLSNLFTQDLLNIVTFHKYKFLTSNDKDVSKTYLNLGQVGILSLIVLVVGVIILSGQFFSFIQFLLFKFYQLIEWFKGVL